MAHLVLSPICPDPSVKQIQYRLARVSKHNTTITIVVIYRPQSTPYSLFKVRLQEVVKSLDLTQPTIILGDFNYDILHTEHDIIKVWEQYGDRQVVTEPTTDYGSLLDHVYMNSDNDCVIDVVDTYYSDHDTVYVSIKL